MKFRFIFMDCIHSPMKFRFIFTDYIHSPMDS